MKKILFLFLASVVLFVFCGCRSSDDEPVIYHNHKLPDLDAYNEALQAEKAAEEAAAAEAESKLRIDWVPVGGYSCITQNHIFYIRIESVNLSEGTAEILYQISDYKGEGSGIERGTGEVSGIDHGDGYFEYTIMINGDMTVYTEGYASERSCRLDYKGSILGMEFHGNGK